LIVGLTIVHARGLHLSSRVQNVLVGLKVLLLVGFVAIGVFFGSLSWPTWVAASPTASPVNEVLGSLFFIAFAFSGWNAAIYAADEFESPERNVPRAMLIGCLAVGALYLVVNFIFVANLTPAQGTVVFQYDDFVGGKAGQFDQVTLGQAVMAALLGPLAAKVMSAVMLLLFISAMSAMLLVGPRVYAAMANDGFLPRFLASKAGKPPAGAVLLQGAIALLLLFTHDVRSVLSNVGAILVLFAALTVSGLFVAKARGKDPSAVSLLCAGVYVISAGWMLFQGFKRSPSLLAWVGVVALVGLGAFAMTRRAQRRPA
jgi:APA family basic amino acid/polyamine antiporter